MQTAPKKILIDARYLWREPSGIGRYSENVIRALGRMDRVNEYTILAREGYAPPADAPANFHYAFLPYAPVSVATLFRVGAWINRGGFDLVHIHCPVIPLGVRAPLVVTLHDWLPLMDPRFTGDRPAPVKLAYDLFYRWHYPFAVRRAARVIANSRTTRDYILRDVPAAADKIAVNHFGVDETFFTAPDPGPRDATLNRLGAPERYLLYVGSSRPNKEVPTLLRAFDLLTRRGPEVSDLTLVMLMSRDRFFPAVEGLIRELNLESRVKIIWNADDETLKAFYSRALALALPSVAEGFGFPVVEAMAQGAPVVISTDGSPGEIAGDAALAVPPRDPAALADALDRVIREPALREKMIEKGRRRAAIYHWEDTAAREVKVYEEILAGAHRAFSQPRA